MNKIQCIQCTRWWKTIELKTVCFAEFISNVRPFRRSFFRRVRKKIAENYSLRYYMQNDLKWYLNEIIKMNWNLNGKFCIIISVQTEYARNIEWWHRHVLADGKQESHFFNFCHHDYFMSLFILCHISCTFTFVVVFLLCRTCCSMQSVKPNNRFTSDVTVVVILYVAIENFIDYGDGDVLTVSMCSIFFISFKESSKRGSKVTAPNRKYLSSWKSAFHVIINICMKNTRCLSFSSSSSGGAAAVAAFAVCNNKNVDMMRIAKSSGTNKQKTAKWNEQQQKNLCYLLRKL